MDSEKRHLKRDELAPLERAVSDTLDEWLYRLHEIVSSWQNPELFVEWLAGRGYTVVAETENAALRERVAELELQVSLLTSNSVEYIITGSANTTPLMTEEECRAILSGDVDALDPSEGIG